MIKTLNTKNACSNGNISLKLKKINEDILQNFNQSLVNGEFFHCSIRAEVVPVFVKKEKLEKSNYRLASILPIISKIYKRLIYEQIYKYFDQIFFKFQYGFRKGFTTQNCLLYMIENWKESLDQVFHYGALLTDLLKPFDCIM